MVCYENHCFTTEWWVGINVLLGLRCFLKLSDNSLHLSTPFYTYFLKRCNRVSLGRLGASDYKNGPVTLSTPFWIDIYIIYNYVYISIYLLYK